MIYVYGKADHYDPDQWLGWTDDHATAEREAESHEARYTDGRMMTLHDDGTVTIDAYVRVPEPYTGPLARARVNYMNTPGSVHRYGPDCARPHNSELNEDHLWRVIGTSVMPNIDSPIPRPLDGHMSVCLCGAWQDIEGEPNAVAEMVAKYPA